MSCWIRTSCYKACLFFIYVWRASTFPLPYLKKKKKKTRSHKCFSPRLPPALSCQFQLRCGPGVVQPVLKSRVALLPALWPHYLPLSQFTVPALLPLRASILTLPLAWTALPSDNHVAHTLPSDVTSQWGNNTTPPSRSPVRFFFTDFLTIWHPLLSLYCSTSAGSFVWFLPFSASDQYLLLILSTNPQGLSLRQVIVKEVTAERICFAIMTFTGQFWILVARKAFVGTQNRMA